MLLKKLILIFSFLLILSSLTYADISNFDFYPPTPLDGSTQTTTDISINLSLSSTVLSTSFIDLDKSLIMWIRGDDSNQSAGTKGAKFYDNSTYGNNMTATGTANQTLNGLFGKGIIFHGNDQLTSTINLGNYVNESGGWTLNIWFNKINDCGGSCTFAYRVTGYNSYGEWQTLGATQIYARFVNMSGTTVTIQKTYGSLLNNTWYMSTIRYNGTHGEVYINGATLGTSKWGIIKGGTQTFTIGSNDFNGTLDNFMYFNRSLSTAEILSLYNSTKNTYLNNFTFQDSTTHTITGYAEDTDGSINKTETRTFTISLGGEVTPSCNCTFPNDYTVDKIINLSCYCNITSKSWCRNLNFTTDAGWLNITNELNYSYKAPVPAGGTIWHSIGSWIRRSLG